LNITFTKIVFNQIKNGNYALIYDSLTPIVKGFYRTRYGKKNVNLIRFKNAVTCKRI